MLVQTALDWFLNLESDEDTLEEIRAAIQEAGAQSSRGEAVPAETIFDELRVRYGIPR